MNTKVSNNLNSIFENTDKLELETSLLALSFLSEIERLMSESGISQKEFAKNIGVSASYITQLFRGHKTPNLEVLTKMSLFFDKVFKVKAVDIESLYLGAAKPTLKVVYNSSIRNKIYEKPNEFLNSRKHDKNRKTLSIPLTKLAN